MHDFLLMFEIIYLTVGSLMCFKKMGRLHKTRLLVLSVMNWQYQTRKKFINFRWTQQPSYHGGINRYVMSFFVMTCHVFFVFMSYHIFHVFRCILHNVHALNLPANLTHLLQVPDVSVFGPFKTMLAKSMAVRVHEGRSVVQPWEIASMTRKAWETACASPHIDSSHPSIRSITARKSP